MKNKAILLFLFFCSLQPMHLSSMQPLEDLEALVMSQDNNVQQIQIIIAKAVKNKQGDPEADQNFQTIRQTLKDCQSDKADGLFVYMESLYKKNSESDNFNPDQSQYTTPKLNTFNVPSSHNTFSKDIINKLTFLPENLEKEKEIIQNLVKDGEKSETAKKYYRSLALKLHPDQTKDNENAAELFKYMGEIYHGKHTQIIATQYEYDFNKIVLKKESINSKNDRVKSAIDAYKAPLLLQAASIIPSLQYKGAFFLTHKAINTAYSLASDKLFGTTSNCYISQLNKEISEAKIYNNDLNEVINQDYKHRKMLINSYLPRKN